MKYTLAQRHPAGRLMMLLAAVILPAALISASARAQTEFDPRSLTGQDMLSDMLMRLSLQTFSGGGEDGIRPDQIDRAEVLLDLALELTPDEPELWNLRAKLARQIEDNPGWLAAMTRYVELRPEDDAYRLQLIMGELAEIETLDGRLSVLEQYLALEGEEALGKPLRSRIASAAAALAQEMGNNDKFLQHLKTAVRSDSANGEAAQMTLQLALERGADPFKLAAASINLVKAQPVDFSTRLLMANALSDLGVYDRACDQFEVAARLPRQGPLDEITLASWARCYIASGQQRKAEDLLNQIEVLLAKPPTEDIEPKPMPVELELQRRILLGDTSEGSAAYTRAAATLEAMIAQGDEDAKLELAWIKAIFGPDTEEVTALLDGQDQTDPRYLRATGFVYMREGADRWARGSFEQHADEDDIAAYGLALLKGKDDAGRARFLRDVMHQSPGSFGGLLAANQLHEMNRDVVPGAQGLAIIDAMNRLPASLWRVDVNRNPWVSIRAKFDASRTAYLEPIGAKITVQNALDIPLPIDPNVGLGGTTFVTVSAFTGGKPIGMMPPIVVDLGRRLTLDARERLVHDTRLDRSIFGLLLTMNAESTLTFNTTFRVDPRVSSEGGMSSGPLGGIDTVRSVQAFIPSVTPPNLEQWSRQALISRNMDKFVALARLCRTGERLTEDLIESNLSRRCIESVLKAYETGGAVEQAWIMLMLSAEDNNRSEFQSILDEAKRSDNDMVQIAYLIRHADESDNQELATAIRDGSARVQRFAKALRAFLELPPPEEPAEGEGDPLASP